MPRVEYHIELTEVRIERAKPDIEALAAQVQSFGKDGWELVTASFGVDFERFGRSDLLVFKRGVRDAEPALRRSGA